ncbi:META domain-containing protein [Flavobacterium adhaerens]|uniref:META domain-containing protein n=1 Tax=Flavobacterium adhaerens TaxID=3149043 RepID=UPI0032B5A64C
MIKLKGGIGVVITLLLIGCKTVTIPQSSGKIIEPSSVYKQQAENMEKGIYFRGSGTEPDWNLKISETAIEFTSLKPGCEDLTVKHVEPIRAMDANVKMYRTTTEVGTMTVQIMQQVCTNAMSGAQSSYSVRIDFEKNGETIHLNGCGNYVTDYRLNDIWVLEKLNGENVSVADFAKELPNLEINTQENKLSGYAGCNRMTGSIFFERGLLRFTNVISTRRACIGNNKESIFLKALQSTTNYSIENNRLILNNPSGVELVFKKVD